MRARKGRRPPADAARLAGGRGILLFAVSLALFPAGCRSRPNAEPSPVFGQARGESAVAPPFRLVDVTAARGIGFRHTYGNRSPITIVETMGSGAAFFDFDRDGWQDIFLVNSGQDFHLARQTPGCRLYRNTGRGRFEDVTGSARIAIDGYAMGCCAGDYDNDGWEDLFVSGYARNFLLHNQGDGTFRDVAARAGIRPREGAWGTGCAFLDLDRDGWLDLYVANYIRYDPKIPLCRSANVMTGCTPNHYSTQRNELYINDRRGGFKEEAVARGADDPAGAGLGVVVSDFDQDGWPDLFVANDGTPNALLRNRRGRLQNVADSAGVAFGEAGVMRAGMGVDAGDCDGDGRFDLVITNFQHEPTSLYRNAGQWLFEDRSYPSGIGKPSMLRLKFGVSFVDLDGDGRVDLYVGNGHVYDNVAEFDDTATFEQPDQVLLNQGGGRFTDLPPSTGAFPATPSVSRGVAVGDLDNDGDPDVLINRLGRPACLLDNQPAAPCHWLGLELRGRRGNRSAVGARVELRGPRGLQVREVRSGGSYLSQSDPRPLFRLGSLADPKALTLRVRWPSGEWQAVSPVVLDRYSTVVEP